jgi:hypothetical protein
MTVYKLFSRYFYNYFIDRRTRDLACAQMKFHKHMRDMLRFKAYFQFNIKF